MTVHDDNLNINLSQSDSENAEENLGHLDTAVPVNSDPALWIISDTFISPVVKQGFNQNINADFFLSKRFIYDRYRFMNKSVFYQTLANGQT